MPIDLTDAELNCVRRIVRLHLPEEEIWVFGSRIQHTQKRYADLDLAIVSDRPLSARRLALLADDLAESDLPFRVDLVDWSTASEPMRGQIDAAHEILLPRATPGNNRRYD